MSMHYYWACPALKEYFSPHAVGDNGKWPADQAAVGLLLLLQGGQWGGCEVRLYSDAGDPPWADWVDGHGDWKNISNHVQVELLESGWVFADDTPEKGVYRYTRVVDELPPESGSRAQEYL